MANNEPYSYDTETAEYKTGIPYRRELARDIAAFANTKGGQIYIGYFPSDEGLLNLTGLTNEQVQEAEQKAKDALRYLRPKPLIDIKEDATLGNKQFVIVTVQKNPTPVIFGERYYVRRENKTVLAEEELIDALSKAVPLFKPNIIDIAEKQESKTYSETRPGKYNIDVEEVQGVVIGDVASGIIQKYFEEKPQTNLNELLKDSIQRTRDDLTTQRKERLQQARITFIVALVVLVLAILLVFVGVVLIFTNKTQAGVVSSVASIVSGIVSGLALAFNKQTNDRLDEQGRELVALEKSYTGMQYISFITDIKVRDEAIHELAKSISLGTQNQ